MRKYVCILLLALFVGTVCKKKEEARGLKVGVVLPLSGSLGTYGGPMINGIKLAVKEINEAGGVLGDTIILVIKDSETDTLKAVEKAKELVEQEGVKFIIGAASSGVTKKVLEYTKNMGVLLMNGCSTSPYFTTCDDNGLFFRTCPSDALQGKALAKLANKEGYTKASIIYVDNPYGEGLADAFEEAFTALGGQVLAKVPYTEGQASYADVVDSAFSPGPEVCILIAYPKEGGTIIRDWAAGGYGGTFLFTDGLKSEDFITNAGAENVEGMKGTAPYTGGPNFDKFCDMYQQEFGEDPRQYVFCDTHYDAMILLALGIIKAGVCEPDSVKKVLQSVSAPPGDTVNVGEFKTAVSLLNQGKDINYEGASGPVDFDEVGDVTANYEVWKIENGQIVSAIEIITP